MLERSRHSYPWVGPQYDGQDDVGRGKCYSLRFTSPVLYRGFITSTRQLHAPPFIFVSRAFFL